MLALTPSGVRAEARAPWVADAGASEETCVACLNAAGNRLVDIVRDDPGRPPGAALSFRYVLCAACATLSLTGAYDEEALYGAAYYSFSPPKPGWIEAAALRMRNRRALFGRPGIGALLERMWPNPAHAALRPLLNGELGPRFSRQSRILDIGCGGGRWLLELAAEGFTRLSGADPFLDADVERGGVALRSAEIGAVEGRFDIVTCHHALEHMEDGEAALSGMARLLEPGGVLVVRIPLGGSYGWRRYGGFWVQLDPPRHRRLYSAAGFRVLAERCGLSVEKVVYDSTHYMITGSEARLAGLDPHGDRFRRLRPREIQSAFGRARATRIANLVNKLEGGDQAAFYLRPKSAA